MALFPVSPNPRWSLAVATSERLVMQGAYFSWCIFYVDRDQYMHCTCDISTEIFNHFMFGSRMGFSGSADSFRQIQDGGSAAILENSNGDISAADRPICAVFGSRMGYSGSADGVGGSNGANSFLTKFNRYVGENNARGVIRLVTI